MTRLIAGGRTRGRTCAWPRSCASRSLTGHWDRPAGAIYHPPQPGARPRPAHLRQGAAHAGRRRTPDPYPRPRLLREPTLTLTSAVCVEGQALRPGALSPAAGPALHQPDPSGHHRRAASLWRPRSLSSSVPSWCSLLRRLFCPSCPRSCTFELVVPYWRRSQVSLDIWSSACVMRAIRESCFPPSTAGTAVTARAVQAAGACSSDRTASSRRNGNRKTAPGHAGGQEHARACQLHSGPGARTRRAGADQGFLLGHLAGAPFPGWVMVYAPPRFQRHSGNGVLVTWPGGLPARRARRQWR